MTSERRTDLPEPAAQPQASGKEPGYERHDANPGATFRAGLLILGAVFLVSAVVIPFYWLLARREAASQPRPATLIRATPTPPALPRLVANEPAALAAFRAKEDALLTSYGWVEKDRGIARMPVAEALRIVGERGTLPIFPPPAKGPAAGGAAAAGGER